MPTKHFGIRTQSEHWYLVEYSTSIFKKIAGIVSKQDKWFVLGPDRYIVLGLQKSDDPTDRSANFIIKLITPSTFPTVALGARLRFTFRSTEKRHRDNLSFIFGDRNNSGFTRGIEEIITFNEVDEDAQLGTRLHGLQTRNGGWYLVEQHKESGNQWVCHAQGKRMFLIGAMTIGQITRKLLAANVNSVEAFMHKRILYSSVFDDNPDTVFEGVERPDDAGSEVVKIISFDAIPTSE